MKNTDHNHAPLVEAWLKEPTVLPPSDTARLMQLVHQTPQQRRWWQRFSSPGRTQTMFNVFKLAAASVILAATGGFLFSTVLAPQDGEPLPPAAETTSPEATDASLLTEEPTTLTDETAEAEATAEAQLVVAPVDVTPADAALVFDAGSGETVGGYTQVGRIATRDRAVLTEMFDLQAIGGLLVARTELLVPGASPGDAVPAGQTQAIVYSDDAVNWASAALPGAGVGVDVEILDLISTDDGLLAAGSVAGGDGREARLWASSDGITWDEVPAPAVTRIQQIVHADGDDILVRAGNQIWIDDEEGGAWRVWNRVNGMTYLSGPGGIVAYQGGGQDQQVPTVVIHWATPHSAISEVQLPEALDYGAIDAGDVPANMGVQVFALDDRWVMVGSEHKAPDEIYVSADGLDWQSVPRPPEMSEGQVRWFADVDGRSQAQGTLVRDDTSPTGVWTFTLGDDVSAADTIGDSGDVWFDAPVAFDGGYVANGWDGGRDQALTLWMTAGADAVFDTPEATPDKVEPPVAEETEAPEATKAPSTPKPATPRAPKATGETAARFTVRDPDPDRGLVTWRDRATDEDGYRIYAKRIYCGLVEGVEPNQPHDRDDFTQLRSKFVRVGRTDADATRFRPVHQRIRDRLPEIPGQQYGSGEIYELYSAAFNEAGESKRVLVGTYITTPEFVCP